LPGSQLCGGPVLAGSVVNSPYRFGRFELNPATRQLLADGEPLTLGARAFDVLVALVERRERLVTKDELLELVWPGLVVEENNLQVQISGLRKALGPHAIATIPGRGYRFAAKLDGDASPGSAPSSAPIERRTEAMRREVPVERAAGETAAPSADAKSIAVLPFTNMSDDNAVAYFADGVQDDLLTQLALLGDLKVVSRTSVAAYRNSGKNIRQIAAELGVGSVVEGSVRRAGDRVRVSAQLIDARSDRHLWAHTYDRELKDIFAIQSELATEIAKALQVSLSPQQEARLAHQPTENLAAYDLYQRYQDLHRRAAAVTADEKLDERIELLERVVELDSKFALAWARLGAEHARKYFYQSDPAETRLAKATQAAERALTLAPDDLAVKAEIGNFYYYGLANYARAAAYFEDLLRLAPNNVAILTQRSRVLRRLGHLPDANALLERAIAVDPRNPDALRTLRQNLEYFRHWDEALALQRRLAQIQPDNIDEQAQILHLEWAESGSSAAYVAWRRTIADKSVRESRWTWFLDLRRALEEGDLETAMRLLETPPAEQSWEGRVAKTWRALLLLAKGDQALAHELARASLREAQAVLAQRPGDLRSLEKESLSHAILGERQAALDAYERWRARLVVIPDALDLGNLTTFRITLYAVLGDRDGALRALEQLVKQRAFFGASAPPELYLFPLRGDPRIQALLEDPANNASLPIVNWNLEKMLAELSLSH